MRGVVNKKGQVWVETVIYTLIGLAVMGLILAMAKPKIDEKRDQVAIEQAVEALRNINEKVYEVQKAVGNRRAVDLKVGRGRLIIDKDNDMLLWEMDISYQHSEEDKSVSIGGVNITTIKANPWRITLGISYSADITSEDSNFGTKELTSSQSTYKLIVENKGKDENGKFIIDIRDS